MKVELLLNDCNKQESHIYESDMVIRTNFKCCKVTTRQHDTREVPKTPQVAIFHDDCKGVKPGPPYPSACFSRDTSTGIRGWPTHYPDVHPRGMAWYRPTR
jgi:hypothetical protein